MNTLRWPRWRSRKKQVHVGTPIPTSSGHRVSVKLPGGKLWYECDDAELIPSTEAFVGALILPAMSQRLVLRCDTLLDPVWLAGARRNIVRFNEWWGYDFDPSTQLHAATAAAPMHEDSARGNAVCFTAGVDSFHELLRDPGRFTHLLFHHGSDDPRDEHIRAQYMRAKLDDIGRHLGKHVLCVRSNLRKHPLTRAMSWPDMHGATLFGAGHLLQRVIGSVTIAASYGHGRLIPWGSRPDSDPDWSSTTFTVRHGDATKWRHERFAAVASHPLVRRHLHVCWKRRGPVGNCGLCHKCLLTMTQLSAMGELDQSAAFDQSISLPDRLNATPSIKPRLVEIWRNVLENGEFPANVRNAVVSLINRSESDE